MYIVKEQKTKRIAAIFKDKEEALDYVATAASLGELTCYIINDTAVTEELYEVIYRQALMESLMNPKIVADKLSKDIIKKIQFFKLFGGMYK